MAIQIVPGQTDDPYFTELLTSLVKALLSNHAVERLWVIQIDNWFDHKWLRFSGMGAIASEIPVDRYDTVKAESYQDQVTFPPFTPNRVISQWSYVRAGDAYIEAPLPALPHPTKRKHSEMNLRRRIQDFSSSACFIWYSSNTVANGRGSIMVYRVESKELECWFAAFIRQPEWVLQATKGTSRSDVQKLLQHNLEA